MLKIIHFLKKESKLPRERIMFMAALSGLANSLLLMVVNLAAEQVANEEMEVRLFFIYLVAFILYGYSQRYALTQTTIAVEQVISDVRLRLVKKLNESSLRFIEQTDETELNTPLIQNVSMISQSAQSLVLLLQSALMLVFSMLYLAWLSMPVMIMTILFISVAMFVYISHYKKTAEELIFAAQQEGVFVQKIGELLKGFKEMKVNQRKNADYMQHLQQLTEQTLQAKLSANRRLNDDIIFSNISFYTLLMVVVFVMPLLVDISSDTVFKITSTILFIIGPVGMFAASLPIVSRSDIAIEGIYQLEHKLDKASEQFSANTTFPARFTDFKTIELRNILFRYKDAEDQSLFVGGPFDLAIHRGEMLFIVGGNGSGKSTLLKLLTGLYLPETGSIHVDDHIVQRADYPDYRELFSVVFTDFHLFDQFYGLPELNDAHVHKWLHELQLEQKTGYVNGKFTNQALSTGQRKRLAFLSAVIENRRIGIFDELAADQDPQFRQRFYQVILPNLKAQGCTVIVVTHDEQYFNHADRILKLQEGKLITLTGS